MPQMSWEETRGIMAEVQELFAGREVCCLSHHHITATILLFLIVFLFPASYHTGHEHRGRDPGVAKGAP